MVERVWDRVVSGAAVSLADMAFIRRAFMPWVNCTLRSWFL